MRMHIKLQKCTVPIRIVFISSVLSSFDRRDFIDCNSK